LSSQPRTTRLALANQNSEESTLLSDVIRSNQKSSERIQSESEALQDTSEIRQSASEDTSCEKLILFQGFVP
jgi:hypothetical protein